MRFPDVVKYSKQFSTIVKKLAELSKINSPLKYAYMAFAVGYLFTPTDVMPDFIPVLGLLDDLLVITWAVDALKENIPIKQWAANVKVKLAEWRLKMDKHAGKYTIVKNRVK